MSLLDPVLGTKANLAPNAIVPGVAATPGWQTVAAFYTAEAARVTLEALISIVQASRLVRVRLVNASTLVQIDLSVISSSQQPITRVVSKPFDLTADTIYQIEAECTGGVGDTEYAVIHSVIVAAKPAE